MEFPWLLQRFYLLPELPYLPDSHNEGFQNTTLFLSDKKKQSL